MTMCVVLLSFNKSLSAWNQCWTDFSFIQCCISNSVPPMCSSSSPLECYSVYLVLPKLPSTWWRRTASSQPYLYSVSSKMNQSCSPRLYLWRNFQRSVVYSGYSGFPPPIIYWPPSYEYVVIQQSKVNKKNIKISQTNPINSQCRLTVSVFSFL